MSNRRDTLNTRWGRTDHTGNVPEDEVAAYPWTSGGEDLLATEEGEDGIFQLKK